jgi:hypothetical protein
MRQSARSAVEKRHVHNFIALEKTTEEQVPNTAKDRFNDIKQEINDACKQDDDEKGKHS